MFLEKSPERLTRRTRIERWWLLALRCLALLALAMVFGRPYLKSTTLPSELPDSSISVILVDRSASMQREDLSTRALAEAEKAIKARKLEDEIAVIFFDRESKLIAGFDEWKSIDGRSRAADFAKRAASSPCGWDVSRPGQALVEAADQISAKSTEKAYLNRDIVLISDFKEGAEFASLNQFAWPEDVSVEYIQITPSSPGNFSLNLAARPEESRTAAEMIHRVRIVNSAASNSDRFELEWKGNPASKITGVVPPGSSRVVKVPASGDTANSGELILSGDAHPFDNTVFIAPPSPLPLPILFVSDEKDSDQVGSPGFYLKRALHPTASLEATLDSSDFSGFAEKSEKASVIVFHGNWSVELASQARKAAESGKLVVALPSPATTSEALAALIDLPGLGLKESTADKYAMLASLDFEHPVLAPFARAQIRDFTKVRFWKHRQLTFPGGVIPKDVTMLAEFDTKTPAWLTKPLGEGSVFVFLSGWEPQESQFALSSKFVPVLYSIFENAGYSAKSAPTFYVGEIDVLSGLAGTEILEKSTRPGLFKTRKANGTEAQIGVNIHPSEGRVDPIDPSLLLAEFNVPVKSGLSAGELAKAIDPAVRKQAEMEEKEAQQKLWKWLIIAVILFLIAETWLSGRRGRISSRLPQSNTPTLQHSNNLR